MSDIMIVEGSDVERVCDDPLAQKVSWSPARRGGTNFKAEKVTRRGSNLVIGKSFGFYLFASLFFLSGLGMCVGFYFECKNKGFVEAWLLGLVGLIFTGVGSLLLFMPRKTTLDGMSGVYYCGKRYQRDSTLDTSKQGMLTDIHALQIVSEHISGSKSSYTSYEINFVFQDGSRLNVMDHGNQKALMESAVTLSEFLSVPIWKKG